jgi:hypothetical protein
LNIKVKGKNLKSIWEQEVKNDMTRKEGRPWEEIEEGKLWEHRNKWRGLVVRRPI